DLSYLEFGECGSQAGSPSGNAGRQQSKVGEQAAAYGQGGDLVGSDHLADFCARWLQRRVARDNHRLLDAGGGQGNVYGCRLADGKDDPGLGVFGESGEHRGQLIISRWEIWHNIIARVIAGCSVDAVLVDLAERN